MKLFLIAYALLGATAAAPAAAADTIYVMRHLQKGQGDDPPLTALGAAKAGDVAQLLGECGVKAVFATATRRAQQTGAPLAERAGLAVTTYDPRNVDALLEAVRAIDGPVLVVGHSNTVPELVERFGGTRPAPLGDEDYGTVFIVRAGSPSVHRVELAEPR